MQGATGRRVAEWACCGEGATRRRERQRRRNAPHRPVFVARPCAGPAVARRTASPCPGPVRWPGNWSACSVRGHRAGRDARRPSDAAHDRLRDELPATILRRRSACARGRRARLVVPGARVKPGQLDVFRRPLLRRVLEGAGQQLRGQVDGQNAWAPVDMLGAGHGQGAWGRAHGGNAIVPSSHATCLTPPSIRGFPTATLLPIAGLRQPAYRARALRAGRTASKRTASALP